jgi:hypothetical protein
MPATAEISAVVANPHQALVQIALVEAEPTEIWNQVRAIAPQLVLNAGGALRGDHAPALGVNSNTGFSEVVWSYWDGTDTEIAWSYFNGEVWSPAELVTDNLVDDEAPTISFLDDGATAVAWETRAAITSIAYRERQPSGAWSPVIPVSDNSADSTGATIAQYQGRIRVGYIQPSTGSQRAIKIASDPADPSPWPGYFTPEIIAQISFSGDIAPELHSYPNQLFTTWVNSSNEIGFARFDGTTWQTPQTETYTSAEDLPKARIRAKSRALHSP